MKRRIDHLVSSERLQPIGTGLLAAGFVLSGLLTFEVANGEETCVQPSLDQPVDIAGCAASIGLHIETINAE